MQKLIDNGCANEETIKTIERALLDVAGDGYGEVNITVKNGRITHVSVTHSYSMGDNGSNPNPHYRSNVSKKEKAKNG